MQNKAQGRNKSLMYLILTALMIALTAIVGTFIRVPTLNGMMQPADCIVLLSAVLLGKKYGFIAGAFGMALIDLLSGYVYWAPFSFIIQGLMALVAAIIIDLFTKKTLKTYITAFIIGGIVSAIGYFIANALVALLITGSTTTIWGAVLYAIAHFPGDVAQIIWGIVIATILAPMVNKARKQLLYH